MIEMSLEEIGDIVGGRVYVCPTHSSSSTSAATIILKGVSIDSRRIDAGQLFVALEGQTVNGNDFAGAATQAGAGACLLTRMPRQAQAVDDGAARQNLESSECGFSYVLVDDAVEALGKIARHNRLNSGVKVFAVTGSTGKTTTKDMLASILSKRYSVVKTEGNQNNELGLPLTLLALDDSHDVAVVEMGMRGLGQIEHLASIAMPDLGIVTNVGDAHTELLGSREAIAKAKSELVLALPPKGWAVLNGDDIQVKAMAGYTPARVCLFGLGPDCDVSAREVEERGLAGSAFKVVTNRVSEPIAVTLSVPGLHNVMNALAAAAAAICAGIDPDAVREGLANYRPAKMRTQISTTADNITIIDDSYNASPASMAAALRTLAQIAGQDAQHGSTPRKMVAVLADMLELGTQAPRLHREIGRMAAQLGVDVLVTVGSLAKNMAAGFLESGEASPCSICASVDDRSKAVDLLRSIVSPGDVVLVKGSRSMKMEEVTTKLKAEAGSLGIG